MDMNKNYRPTLMIDTCAMSDKRFLDWLRGYSGPKKISAVSYMEYLAFLLDIGRTAEWADDFMNKLKIRVEHFDKDDAVNATFMIHEHKMLERRCPSCRQINWNDTMVASHGRNYSCVLVTENVRDFPYSDSMQIMTPEQVIGEVF